jgi:hypothetical protein
METGYAIAGRGMAILLNENPADRRLEPFGKPVDWLGRSLDEADFEMSLDFAGRTAISPDGRNKTADILSRLAAAGVPNRSAALAATFLRGGGLASNDAERANVLFFGFLAQHLIDAYVDPAPEQFPDDRRQLRDLTRNMSLDLPPSAVVAAYREALAWRAQAQ